MLDPALPPSFKAEFDDLKRRLRTLEGAPRLQNSSINNGTLTLLDEEGRPVARLGVQPDGRQAALDFYDPETGNRLVSIGEVSTGAHGIAVKAASGANVYRALNVGQTSPFSPFVWVPSPTATKDASTGCPLVNTTSASWTTLARVDVYTTAYYPHYELAIDPLGGSTADIRVFARELGGSNTQILQTVTGATSYTAIYGGGSYFTAAATATGTDDPLGRYMRLGVEVRRTAGAGDVLLRLISGGYQATSP